MTLNLCISNKYLDPFFLPNRLVQWIWILSMNIRAKDVDISFFDHLCILVRPAQEVVKRDPLARLGFHLCQRRDDAGVCLLPVGVDAGAVHGTSEAQDNVVLGHAVLVLVDLVSGAQKECQVWTMSSLIVSAVLVFVDLKQHRKCVKKE